jgi:hypothetical protein
MGKLLYEIRTYCYDDNWYFYSIYYRDILYGPVSSAALAYSNRRRIFLVAYNFELFSGFFHNNLWFAISWEVFHFWQDTLSKRILYQRYQLSQLSIAYVISYLEIRISRVYKELRRGGEETNHESARLEYQLKVISLGTVIFALFLYMPEVL